MYTLQYRNQELQLINYENLFGIEAIRIYALRLLNIFVAKDGYLYINRYDRNKKKRVVHRYTSINKAIGSQKLIKMEYEHSMGGQGELQFLNKLADDLDTAIISFETWEKLSDQAKIDNRSLIIDNLHKLEKNRQILLVMIKSQITNLASPRDRRGRLNPGSKKASIAAAKTKVDKRKSQVLSSRGLAERRKLALLIEKQYMEKNLLSAKIQLQLLTDELKTRDPIEYKRQIGKIKYFLQSVWLEPYFTEANSLNEKINALK